MNLDDVLLVFLFVIVLLLWIREDIIEAEDAAVERARRDYGRNTERLE